MAVPDMAPLPPLNPIGGQQGPMDTLNNVLGAQQKILGMAQAVQGLQTGQLQQQALQQDIQTGAINQQMLQQKQRAQLNLGTFLSSSLNDSQYLHADGSVDADKWAQHALQFAGPYAADMIGQAQDIFSKGMTNRQEIAKLDIEGWSDVVGNLRGIAQYLQAHKLPDGTYDNPKALIADQQKGLDAIGEIKDEPGFQKAYKNMLQLLPRDPDHGWTDSQFLDRRLNFFNQMALQTFAQKSINMRDENNNEVLVNPDTGTAMYFGTGAPAAPDTPQAPDGMRNIGPKSPPNATIPPARPGFNAANQALNLQQVQGLAQRLQSYQTNDTKFQESVDNLTRLRAILDDPNAPRIGGSGAETFLNLKANIQRMIPGLDFSSVTDGQELAKMFARYQASKWQGGGMTDSAGDLMSKGTGSLKLDNQAAKDVVTQSLASDMAGHVYAEATRGMPAQQAAANEQKLNSMQLAKGYEMQLMRNPQEVQAFLKRTGLTLDDARAIVKRMDAAKLPTPAEMGLTGLPQ